MKKHVLFLLFCLLTAGAFSQNYRLNGKKLENFTLPALQKSFEHSAVYQISVNDLLQYAQKVQNGFGLQLNLPGLPAMDAQLEPSGIMADNYTTIIADDHSSRTTVYRYAIYPFISQTNDGKTCKAALTIAPGFVYGLFEQDGRTWYMEPLWYFDKTQPQDLVVVYESTDVIQTPGNGCAQLEVEHENELADERSGGGVAGPPCGPPELELAIANDYKMVQKYGSVANVIAHNVGVMNDAQANWDDEFNKPVMFKIVAQFVPATAGADPFPATNDIITLLPAFQAWANGGGFGAATYDLGHLRASRTFNGGALGAAYTQQLCSAYRYGVLSDVSLSACGLRTVVSHEMGHSFGAHHDTDIMNAVFNGCTNVWSATSLGEINGLLDAWPCLTPMASCPLPTYIPAPEALSEICTGSLECYTLPFNPCINSYTATTNDPYLQITINDNTICLNSTAAYSRTSFIFVTPLDYCGNPPLYDPNEPNGSWMVKIDGPHCSFVQGGDSENRSQNGSETGLSVYQSGDYLHIEDFNKDPRNKDIRIFDMNGRLLLQEESSAYLQQISLNSLPVGVLVVKVNAGNQVLTKRIIHL